MSLRRNYRTALMDSGQGNVEEFEAELEEKDQIIENLENEKKELLEDISKYEAYITDHVEQIRTLASIIDNLTAQPSNEIRRGRQAPISKRVGDLKNKLTSYHKKLAKKDSLNKKLQEQLMNERDSRRKIEEAIANTTNLYKDMLRGKDNIENERLQFRMTQIEDLEREKQALEEEIERCHRQMQKQNDKIEALIQEQAKRENKMQNYIAKCESKINDMQNELKDTAACCSNEKIGMRNRIEDLEQQLEACESAMLVKDENNKDLLQALDKEKAGKAQVERVLEATVRNDEHSHQMLKQAHDTIKSITQQLEMYDIERLESERNNQIKISELEERLKTANNTIKQLRDNLDQMKEVMDQNEALKLLSGQLYDAANLQVTSLENANEDLNRRSQQMSKMYDHLRNALYEKDKTFDDLKNQLIVLRQELENEQRLREDTEIALEDIAAAGDSEKNRLIKHLNAQREEIAKLQEEINFLESNTNLGRVHGFAKKLEEDNRYLERALENTVAQLDAVLPGYVNPKELAFMKSKINELSREVERRKEEEERQNNIYLETIAQLQDKVEKYCKRITELQDEKNLLKAKMKPTPGLLLVEKQLKPDGEATYTYLGNVAEPSKEKKVKVNVPQDQKKSDKNEQNSASMKELLDEVVVLRKRLSELQSEIRNKNLALASLQEQNVYLQHEVNRLKERGPECPEVHPDFVQERNQLLREIEVQKMEIANLLSKLNNATSPTLSVASAPVAPEDIGRPSEQSKLNEDFLQLALSQERQRVKELEEKLNQCQQEVRTLKASKEDLEWQVQTLTDLSRKMSTMVRNSISGRPDSLPSDTSGAAKRVSIMDIKAFPERPMVRKFSDKNNATEDLEDMTDKEKLVDGKFSDKNTETEEDYIEDMKDKRIQELEETLENWQAEYSAEIRRLKEGFALVTDSNSCEAHKFTIKNLKASLEETENLNRTLEAKIAILENDNMRISMMFTGDAVDDGDDDEGDKKMVHLIDHIRALQKRNELLKTRTILLELDNVKLKGDIEKIIGKEHKSVVLEMERLGDLEKQLQRSQNKYSNLRKRLIKLEIENRNLKKEYIETLIDKEKIKLHGQEQTKRLRETGKILRNTQDKKHNLTVRFLDLQRKYNYLEAEMGAHVCSESGIVFNPPDPEENEDKLASLLNTSSAEQLNPQLRGEIEQMQKTIIRLRLDNDHLRKVMDDLRDKDKESLCASSNGVLDNTLEMTTIELRVENEFLKHELEQREKSLADIKGKETLIEDLEKEIKKYSEEHGRLKTLIMEIGLENEYLKQEQEKIVTRSSMQQEPVDEDVKFLKVRVTELTTENDNLRSQIELMGKTQISLQAHAQEKLLRQIQEKFAEYESYASQLQASTMSLTEEKKTLWKKEIEPELMELKGELDKITGANDIKRFKNEVKEMRANTKILQRENAKLKIMLNKLLSKIDRIDPGLASEVDAEAEKMLRFQEQDQLKRLEDHYQFQIKSLKAECAEYRQLNEMLKQTKVSLDAEFQDHKIQDMQLMLKHYQKSAKMSNTNLAASKFKSNLEELEHLRQLVQELQEQNRVLQKEKKVSFHSPDMMMRLNEKEQENEILRKEYLKLQETLEENEKRMADLEEQLKKCRDANKGLKDRVTELEIKNKAHEKHVSYKDSTSQSAPRERSSSGPSDSEEKAKDLEQQLEKSQKSNENLKIQYEKVEKQLMKKENDVEALEKEISKLCEEKSCSEGDNKALKEELHEYQKRYKDVKKELQRLEKTRLAVQGKKFDKRITDLEEELTECKVQNEIFQAKIDFLRKEVATKEKMEEEINELGRSLAGSEQFISSLTKEISSLEKQLEKEVASNMELRTENQVMKEKINSLSENLSSSEELVKSLSEEVTSLKDKVQLLGGGEDIAKEMSIRDLETQTETNFVKTCIRNLEIQTEEEFGKGDVDGKVTRMLEETLCKYQDNNEYLKTRIVLLQAEKEDLQKQLERKIEEDFVDVGSEDIAQLSDAMIADNDEYLQSRTVFPESERVFAEETKQTVSDNGSLKETILGLEQEIKKLRQEISTSMEQRERKEQAIRKTSDKKLLLVKKNEKKILLKDKGTQQNDTSDETISELQTQKPKRRTKVEKLREKFEGRVNVFQPLMPSPFGYNLVPVVWQMADKPRNVMKIEASSDEIAQPPDRSRKVLQKGTTTSKTQKEEKEQAVLNYEDSQPSVFKQEDKKVTFGRQVLKHRETQAKIAKLRTDIQETMKVMEEVSRWKESVNIGTTHTIKRSPAQPALPKISNKTAKIFDFPRPSPPVLAHLHATGEQKKGGKYTHSALEFN